MQRLRVTTGSTRRGHPWVRALFALAAASAVMVVGVTWMARSMATAPPSIDHAHAIAVDDAGRLVLGHHGGMMMSADGGRSWTSFLEGWDVMAAVPGPTDTLLVAGHGFVGSVDPAGALVRLDRRLSDRDVHALAFDPAAGDIWIATASGAVLRSEDRGASWETMSTGPVALLAVRDGMLVGIDPFEGVVTSPDGQSWRRRGVPPTSPVTSLAGSPTSSMTAITGSNGVWVSEDLDATWRMVSHGPAVAATFRERDGALLVVEGDGAVRELPSATLVSERP